MLDEMQKPITVMIIVCTNFARGRVASDKMDMTAAKYPKVGNWLAKALY